MAQGTSSVVVSRKLTRLPILAIHGYLLLSPTANIITVMQNGIVTNESTFDWEIVVWWGGMDNNNTIITGSSNGVVRILTVSKEAKIQLVKTLPMPEASCNLVDVCCSNHDRILALLRGRGVYVYENDSWRNIKVKLPEDPTQWIRPYGVGGMVLFGMYSVRYYDADRKKHKIPTGRRSGIITTCAVRDRCICMGYKNGTVCVVQNLDIIRILHWHSHAVVSIAIGMDGSIHSGAEEAVWITWDAVNDRPKQMKPRIAPAGIDRLLTVGPDKMVIYANNTIHMYDILTQRLIWAYQGVVQTAKTPQIYGAVGENRLAMSGSPGHIYLFQNHSIQSRWTIAHYNRVSNAPPPNILDVATHNGQWLTVHENILECSPNLIVTKFWDRPNRCVASMVQREAILACSLHKETAITITKDELHFWDNNATTWTCRTKVAIPAGFAKHTVKAKPAYSPDGSVVAVAFGRHVTTWNPTDEKLLISIPLVEDIQQILFAMDSLVIRTMSKVTCMSACGKKHWMVAIHATSMCVADDAVVVSGDGIVLVLDAFTGMFIEEIQQDHGSIVSMHAKLQNDHRVQIHAFTETGELIRIEDPYLRVQTAADTMSVNMDETRRAPTLPIYKSDSRKRRFIEISDLDDWCPSKMVSIEQLTNDELPLMRGEFVMAFLGRNLRRKPPQ